MTRRILSLFLVVLVICGSFSSCTSSEEKKSESVLRVYNWQEYIYDGTDEDGVKVSPSVMEAWAEDYYNRTGERVRVVYDTFETNETMLNTLKTGKSQYDLVCPSDYVIQKMIAATEKGTDDNISLEKFDYTKLDNYKNYASPYIQQVFEEYGFSEYSVGYMWGTVGIVYNPETVDSKDVQSWNVFWNPKYKNRMTVKDSVRDAYIPAVSRVYNEEINDWALRYKNGTVTLAEYQKRIDGIQNSIDEETLEKVGEVLREMKGNVYGLEVDSGKSDIVSGKIDINQAWSGDAVYAMNLAEEEDDMELAFTVPEDGGSVWFDGWVMPKGANVELAMDFVNYLCRPDVAAQNMDFIGYTSVIAGNEIFDLVQEWYGPEEDAEGIRQDLTYFFRGTLDDSYLDEDGLVFVSVDEHYLNRQFTAQYPPEEVVDRCSVMRDFGDRNSAVLHMWLEFKASTLSVGLVVFFLAILLGACLVLLWFTKPKRDSARRRKEWKAKQG